MQTDELYRQGKILFDSGRYAEAAPYLLQAAEAGHADAQDDYGFLCRSGHGVPQDLEAAESWYTKAAEQGHADARHNLAVLLVEKGGETGIKSAFAWFKVSAGEGHALSQLQLAHWYRRGIGVDADLTEALRLFSSSADQGNQDAAALTRIAQRYGAADHKGPYPTFADCQTRAQGGDPKAMRLLGAYYMLGYGCGRPDTDAARDWIERAAQAGDIPAMRASGGFLADQDPAAAAKLWETAAEAGDVMAMYLLALSLLDGLGIEADPQRALELLAAAADAGFVDAMVVSGDHYRVGDRIAQDFAQAVRWYKRSAQEGHMESQYFLAMLLTGGYEGVPADIEMGMHWLQESAKRGWADAQTNLGIRFLQGDGVEQDDKRGAKWLRAAAEQNDAHAQYTLGVCYFNGRGLPRDQQFGAHLWRKAAAEGHSGAADALQKLNEG